LLWALASLKGPDERIRIPGFYDRAKPPLPHDLKLIADRPSDEEQTRKDFGIKEFLRGVSTLKRRSFSLHIEGITSGYQGQGGKTVIPARASAKVDFRLVPDQDPTDILEKLEKHLASEGFGDVQVKWLGAMWPSRVPHDHPLVELNSRTALEVYGKKCILIPMTGGSSPVYAFADLIFGHQSGLRWLAHVADENIRLNDFTMPRHIAEFWTGCQYLMFRTPSSQADGSVLISRRK
jgi:acetylornithine deacetylase/succinyl-diaminopimelate desuccinylase-like protein